MLIINYAHCSYGAASYTLDLPHAANTTVKNLTGYIYIGRVVFRFGDLRAYLHGDILDMDYDLISSIIAGIGLFITLLISVSYRFWLRRRNRKITYLQKRFKLIDNLLNKRKKDLSKSRVKGLKAEFELIAIELIPPIRQTKHDRLQNWRKRSFRIRLFTIPKPVLPWEWYSALFYYLYLFAAMIYSIVTIMTILFLGFDGREFDIFVLSIVSLFTLGVCIFMRSWRIDLAQDEISRVLE